MRCPLSEPRTRHLPGCDEAADMLPHRSLPKRFQRTGQQHRPHCPVAVEQVPELSRGPDAAYDKVLPPVEISLFCALKTVAR